MARIIVDDRIGIGLELNARSSIFTDELFAVTSEEVNELSQTRVEVTLGFRNISGIPQLDVLRFGIGEARISGNTVIVEDIVYTDANKRPLFQLLDLNFRISASNIGLIERLFDPGFLLDQVLLNGSTTIDATQFADDIRGGGGNDLLIARSGNDTLRGESGSDTLRGGAGNDILVGGAGNDKLFGDSGADTAVFSRNQSTYNISETSGGDLRIQGEGVDIVDSDVEFVRFRDGRVTFDEVLNPQAPPFDLPDLPSIAITQAATRVGGGAADRLFGSAGDDVIRGEGGDDVIKTGSGSDQVHLGDGDDTVLSGIGDDVIIGGSGGDIIKTSSGGDRIDGGTGDDVILSGNDDDIVIGGAGDDVVKPGRGDDEIFGGDGDDIVVGFRGGEIMLGGDGNDRLIGGLGDDVIVGGDGDDRMRGGPGRDRFLFEDADFGTDRIVTDFRVGSDLIDFSRADEIESLSDLSIRMISGNTVILVDDSDARIILAGVKNLIGSESDVFLF